MFQRTEVLAPETYQENLPSIFLDLSKSLDWPGSNETFTEGSEGYRSTRKTEELAVLSLTQAVRNSTCELMSLERSLPRLHHLFVRGIYT